MDLAVLWFVLVAVLWAGFLVLDGFDLGVGVLHRRLGRTEDEESAAIASIGPVWDGNVVWLVVAVAAMLGAFPAWYAAVFSAFYLPILLLLCALIVRGVSFEFRDRSQTPGARTGWGLAMIGSSLLVPLLVGLVLGGTLAGIPLDARGDLTGTAGAVLTWYGLGFGVALALLCLLHGATWLAVRTTEDLRERARGTARSGALPVAVLLAALAVWTALTAGRGPLPGVVGLVGALALVAARQALRHGRDLAGFVATGVAMLVTVLSLFTGLYPRVVVASTGPAYDLTVANAASGPTALTAMAIATAVLFPVVLLYQGWAYTVFHDRVQRAAPPQAD
jgi:cytochrome bd ubiquinol oxidase subunit II